MFGLGHKKAKQNVLLGQNKYKQSNSRTETCCQFDVRLHMFNESRNVVLYLRENENRSKARANCQLGVCYRE